MKKSTLFLLCFTGFGLITSVHAGPNLKHPTLSSHQHAPKVSVSHRQPIDINTADAKSLANSVDGIGLTRAKAIVAYRDAHGRLNSVEDLAKVKGISSRTMKKYREQWRRTLFTE